MQHSDHTFAEPHKFATVSSCGDAMFAGHPLDGQVRQGIKGPEYAHPIRIGDDCWIGGSAIFLGMTLRAQALNDQQVALGASSSALFMLGHASWD